MGLARQARCCRRHGVPSMPWCCYFCSPAAWRPSSLSWASRGVSTAPRRLSPPSAPGTSLQAIAAPSAVTAPSGLQAAGSASSSAAAPIRLAGPPGGMGSECAATTTVASASWPCPATGPSSFIEMRTAVSRAVSGWRNSAASSGSHLKRRSRSCWPSAAWTLSRRSMGGHWVEAYTSSDSGGLLLRYAPRPRYERPSAGSRDL